MSDHTQLRALARRQLGLVRRDQLTALDYTPAQLWRLVESGTLEVLSPAVYRIGGAPWSARQAAYAAVLDGGTEAAASHSTAAALWRLPGYDIEPVHITRMSRRHRRSSNLGVVHEPKLLLPQHVAPMGPLQVTSPSRLLFDLAAWVHVDKLARTTDDVLVKRHTNVRALHEMLRLLGKRGRAGIRKMRAVLDERPPGYRPPESHLESRVQVLLRRAGLWGFERQIDIGDDDGWIGRVDFYERDTLTILQVDGDRWHTGLVDRLTDAAQVARLERAGFAVIRVTEGQVWLRPDEVGMAVRACRDRRPLPVPLLLPASGHVSSRHA
jgi:very-short-patch-repair endonuclease